MSFWGEEDQDFLHHLKECGEHLIIVLAWLFSIKVTLVVDGLFFGSPNTIVTLIILFEEFAIVLTIVKYCSKMLKWFYLAVKKDITESELSLPIPN
jgi:hypothetical protein